MTEELPPFAYYKDDKLQGLSVDIVRAILARLDLKDSISVLPWARAYHETLKKPNHVLFSMSRNNEREYSFQWVGPIIEDRVYFYSHVNTENSITSIEDAKKAKTVIVSRDFPEHKFLQDKGFNNLSLVVSPAQGFKRIISKRGDLMPAGELTVLPTVKRLKINGLLLKNTGVQLFSHYLYIAMSLNTPQTEVKRWQQALDQIKTDGAYKKIIDKYVLPTSTIGREQ